MKNIFSGVLAGILIVVSIFLLAVTAGSVYFILKEPIPDLVLSYSGLYSYLQIFAFPLLTSAAFLYVLTLIFIILKIQQVNNSVRIIRDELITAGKPRLFLQPIDLAFNTQEELGKLNFNHNRENATKFKIINAGREPALDIECTFVFDYQTSIKLIKGNDLFKLFVIGEEDEMIIIKSDKLGYTSKHKLASLNYRQKNDYILPPTEGSVDSGVIIPDVYLELFYWYNEITNGDKVNDFPELRCTIKYKRINNTTFMQKFSVTLEQVNYSPGLRGDKLYDSTSIFHTAIKSI